MFGLPESGLAETLREAETLVPGFAGLEITTCLRRGEVEVVTRFEPADAPVYDAFREIVRARQALWDHHKVAVEHGAATALAALTSPDGHLPDGDMAKICVVLCGANTDPADLVKK